MSTLASEQRAFLRRLRSDPAFLLKHAAALSFAVFNKIRNKTTIAVSTRHRGRKMKPDWLPIEELVTHRQQTTGTALDITALPIYPCGSRPLRNKSVANAEARAEENDMEDYLAEHRWGFLLVSLLNECTDRRSDFDACIRWIEKNFDKADRMWEPYSACERVANLLIYIAATRPTMRADEIPTQLLEFLDDSLKWIYQHLEYYGSSGTNNHILNNARALVMAGVAIGNRAAISAGMTIFRNCLPLLVMRGGFLRERSSHYQLIVLNWMLDSWRFIVAREGEESDDATLLHGFIGRMVRAASMLCGSDVGMFVMIGDVSPDATPAESGARLALLYPDLWPLRESWGPVEVTDGWFRISMAQEVIVGNFPAGRYPPNFPTHGHCDLTSFVWLHAGQEILGDSGRYRYTADAVSLFQKSAIGHNLPIVNGFAPLCETLVANGLWWPLPYAAAELESIACDAGIMLVHDGFSRATPVTRHARRIVAQESTLLVVDSFEGSGEADMGFCWHFGEAFDGFDAEQMVASGRWGQVRIGCEGVPGPPRVEPVFGAFPGGWTSYTYGRKRQRLGICLHWSVSLPATISTRFVLTVVGAP
jgi:Heparinase II/III-like protein